MAAGSKLQFWAAPVCPYAQRGWIALTEAGADYDYRKVDLHNKSAEFEALYRKVRAYSGALPWCLAGVEDLALGGRRRSLAPVLLAGSAGSPPAADSPGLHPCRRLRAHLPRCPALLPRHAATNQVVCDPSAVAKVPVLVDGGLEITESPVVAEYVLRQYGADSGEA